MLELLLESSLQISTSFGGQLFKDNVCPKNATFSPTDVGSKTNIRGPRRPHRNTLIGLFCFLLLGLLYETSPREHHTLLSLFATYVRRKRKYQPWYSGLRRKPVLILGLQVQERDVRCRRSRVLLMQQPLRPPRLLR